MKQIPLTQGKFAIVDDEDFIFLNRFKWYYQERMKKSGIKNPTAVAYLDGSGGKVIEMTRLLVPMNDEKAKVFEGSKKKKLFEVVHLNKNFLDFRKENLKLLPLADVRQLNRKRGGTISRYKGIWVHKDTGMFYSEIRKDGVRYRLGNFKTENEAALAYNKKALELYGELAYQNIIT